MIESGDGTGNTSAPPNDPGWSQTANVGAVSGIYLGGGWVLTANHAKTGPVSFNGATYQPIEGSEIRLSNPDGSGADLKLLEIQDFPPGVPTPVISSSPPPIGEEVILIGRAFERGDATTFDPPGPDGPYHGFEWGGNKKRRWGTNEIVGHLALDPPNVTTITLATSFDPSGSDHEGTAVTGDSGGPVFWYNHHGVWELAGIMYARTEYDGQPAATSLYGNETWSADLSAYREQILEETALPEPAPSQGLFFGAALLAMLAQLRRRRG